MVKVGDVNKAYFGSSVECEIKFNKDILIFNLKPLYGNILGKLEPIFKHMSKMQKRKSVDNMSDEELESLMKLRSILHDWLISDIEGDTDEERSEAVYTLLSSDETLKDVMDAFIKVHGLDKQTEREEFLDEVAEIGNPT